MIVRARSLGGTEPGLSVTTNWWRWSSGRARGARAPWMCRTTCCERVAACTDESTCDELAQVSGIGTARAARIVAALELGRRTLTHAPGARVLLRTPPGMRPIKSVFEGVNPQGCEVTSFKQPLDPRSSTTISCGAVAAAGARPDRHLQPLALRRVLMVRVHKELLAEKIPKPSSSRTSGASGSRTLPPRALSRAQGMRDPEILSERLEGEQRQRFLDGWRSRPRTGNSRWPMSPSAAVDRYMAAYQD